MADRFATLTAGSSVMSLLKRADTYDASKPVVAYFCRERALQATLSRLSVADSESIEAELGRLMEVLESAKPTLGVVPETQVYFAQIENEAISAFTLAEKAYRGGVANKASIVHFMNAGFLLEALTTVQSNEWSALPKYKDMYIYAKKSAALIAAALKQGVHAMPPMDSIDEEMLNSIHDVPGIAAAAPTSYAPPPVASATTNTYMPHPPPNTMAFTQPPPTFSAPPVALQQQWGAAASPPTLFQQPSAALPPPSASSSSSMMVDSPPLPSAVSPARMTAPSSSSSHGIGTGGAGAVGGNSGSGPSDPRLRDAMELTRFAMAAIREGNKSRAIEFLGRASQTLQQ